MKDPVRPVAVRSADEPEAQQCSGCGAPMDVDQTYCLECGEPTPLAPPLPRPVSPWWVAAAVVAVAAAGVFGYALASRGPFVEVGGETAAIQAAPSETASAPVQGPPTAEGSEVVTVPSAPSAAGAVPWPSASPPVGAPTDWPAGRSGWTVVVASTPTEAEARAIAQRVQSTGHPAGVLLSSDYSTLRPGYYVVFSGVLDSHAQAAGRAAQLSTAYPGAYPAEVAE